jgi:hypothetical protein
MTLRAPDQALRYSPGGRTVVTGAGRMPSDGLLQLWILRDRGPTAIMVQLGLADGTYTEIVKGDVSDELIIGESGGTLGKQKP